MANKAISAIWHGKALLTSAEHEAMRTGYLLGVAYIATATGAVEELCELSTDGEKALSNMLGITSRVLANDPVRRDEIAEALEMAMEINTPVFKELLG